MNFLFIFLLFLFDRINGQSKSHSLFPAAISSTFSSCFSCGQSGNSYHRQPDCPKQA